MLTKDEIFGYPINPDFSTSVAYFSMEFAIDQALKIYCGGLGFLAGSHLRSAYQFKQNLIGIGILWKYGYYDQRWNVNHYMEVSYVEKSYAFLEDTGIQFTVTIDGSPVHVKAWLLRPEVFGTAPLFLLSTDVIENDHLSQSITRRIYAANEATRISQSIILGIGGARLLDILNLDIDVYHMNEGHSLPLNFYLLSKFKDIKEVRKRVVFTTHTPDASGNEEHSISLLKEMDFFHDCTAEDLKDLLSPEEDKLNYTLAALRLARKANAVSLMHRDVSMNMWSDKTGICEITSITNAQNKDYWSDKQLDIALRDGNDSQITARKLELKKKLFKVVADQAGKLFDENTLTIVWARRFAAYKRADLLMSNWDRFIKLVNKVPSPIQIIWAGKPYPEDQEAVALFNHIVSAVRPFKNCAVLVNYELHLSALLKKGSDIWLNTPRLYREASGTSGMSAAMAGSLNFSIPDGWIPEFARDGENCFLIQPADEKLSTEEKDKQEAENLMDVLENTIIPMYYNNRSGWLSMMKQAAKDVVPDFESSRMVQMYYSDMYKLDTTEAEEATKQAPSNINQT